MTRAWQDLRKARWGAEGQVGAGGQVGGCAPPPAQLGYGKVWGLERVGGSLMVAGMGSGAGGWTPISVTAAHTAFLPLHAILCFAAL